MLARNYWIKKIELAWQKQSVVWLSGVRRVGKTCLSQSLNSVEYFDCELPRCRQQINDPEAFLESLKNKRIILDEIHRLDNPAELLKIAADHYPSVKILATGSSTFGASAKFSDTLTGRKVNIWLAPMIWQDLYDFGSLDLRFRFLRGGLPPMFCANELPELEIKNWLDSYWSKDIQELFRLEKKMPFQKLVELVAINSGGIFEATNFAVPCEISRQTVTNYLAVLEATYVAYVLRPYSNRKTGEIVTAPKVYIFDTGILCYFRGWQELRKEDLGLLFEHFVLNELLVHSKTEKILYWRDKQGHEIDFVIVKRGRVDKPIAIECKWSSSSFDPSNLRSFRKRYPEGKNYLIAFDVNKAYKFRTANLEIEVHSVEDIPVLFEQNFE